MSIRSEAQKQAGQLIVSGFQGPTLPASTSKWIGESGLGTIILFNIHKNYESPLQVAELIQSAQDSRNGPPLWVSLDQEGGPVQRFKTPFTTIPPALSIGEKDSPQLVYDISELMAKELKAVGANLNYAPCADILTNPSNPVIGKRSFGETEERVSKMVSAFVRGHLTQGVQPCVKHFPGHGDTHVDSHFALPTVDTPLRVLEAREFRPFAKAIKSGCSFVMTAHILNRNLDPEKPATLSATTLHRFLRSDLRFQGAIVSDDMQMQAITDHYGAEEAPLLALHAGVDLLCYRNEEIARAAHESIIRAIESGKLSPERVLESSTRLLRIKKESLPAEPRFDPRSLSVIGCEAHQRIIQEHFA